MHAIGAAQTRDGQALASFALALLSVSFALGLALLSFRTSIPLMLLLLLLGLLPVRLRVGFPCFLFLVLCLGLPQVFHCFVLLLFAVFFDFVCQSCCPWPAPRERPFFDGDDAKALLSICTFLSTAAFVSDVPSELSYMLSSAGHPFASTLSLHLSSTTLPTTSVVNEAGLTFAALTSSTAFLAFSFVQPAWPLLSYRFLFPFGPPPPPRCVPS